MEHDMKDDKKDFNWIDSIIGDTGRWSEELVRKTIKTYGVNAKDRYNRTIFNIITTPHFTFRDVNQLIDVIFEYHPLPSLSIIPPYIYPDIFMVKGAYILEKFLEQDTNYNFNRYKCASLGRMWNNLLELMIYFRDKIELDHKIQIVLLSNHMNRGMTFFDLMKNRINDVNTIKK